MYIARVADYNGLLFLFRMATPSEVSVDVRGSGISSGIIRIRPDAGKSVEPVNLECSTEASQPSAP